MSETTCWTDSQRALWQRINAHDLERCGDALDFAARLAREHGWSTALAHAAVEEYRRFCFLALAAGHPVTPGADVDEVWHQHLLDTRDYWGPWCTSVLCANLHHEPTRGGNMDARKHYAQYSHTLASYQRFFGPPPARFWPAVAEQFGNPSRYRRVDLRQVRLLPRLNMPGAGLWQRWSMAIALLLLAPHARAGDANPLDWSGPEFLMFFIFLAIVSFPVSAVLRRLMRRTSTREGSVAALPMAEVAYLAGGPERVVDTGIAELMAREMFEWDAQGKRLAESKRSNANLEFPLDLIAQQVRRSSDVRAITRRLKNPLRPLHASLVRRGLLLDSAQMLQQRVVGALPFAAVFLLGAAKIVVGMDRQRPVGFLVFLTLLVLLFSLITIWKTSTRSAAGEAALRQLRDSKTQATRAPLTSDVGIAVALAGTAVLSGTAYAAYHEARTPMSSSSGDSSSGSSCSSSSDSGGSSCSSGCGGCGGGGGD
ncbi:MAG: TIGR04222 domain-containing membrane protein [Tahibacter sp.]